MAHNKELENEIYHNALSRGLSYRDAMDMVHRVMGISGSPRDPYASMADQFSDTLPHVGGRGNDYSRLQPRHDEYYENYHGSSSSSRKAHGDRYEDRGAYNVREVRPACSSHSSYSTPFEYGYADQSSRYNEREVHPGGSYGDAYETSNRYGYERSSSRYDTREERHSDHFDSRDSSPRPRQNHSTFNSYAADSGRMYKIPEVVPGGSTHNPRSEFPRAQTRGGNDYFERTPPSSDYSPHESSFRHSFYQTQSEPRGEVSSENRRTYNYNTRTAVPDGMPLPSLPPYGAFPPPPRPPHYGYGTRNTNPNTPHPSLVPKTPTVDLYAILGVSRTATVDEMKKVYRKLSLQYHPDRAQGNKEQATVMMAKINQAYDVLKNETRREEYDKTGEF
jgi:hypothetical protein